jgi:hypothetical protein
MPDRDFAVSLLRLAGSEFILVTLTITFRVSEFFNPGSL